MDRKIDKFKQKLGRIYIPDERDSNFLMKAMLPKKAPERTYRYWWDRGWKGDQGLTSQCVAYAWIHYLEDGPVTQKLNNPPIIEPPILYKEAQRNDQWVGEAYDGTSVRGAAKALQQRGLISSYYWAKTADEVVRALLTSGPVVIGVNWYTDMFFPDSDGIIKIGGIVEGGHAVTLTGVNTKSRMVRGKNSWGPGWGKNGNFYMSFDDLDRLLKEYGEAAISVEIEKL